MATSHQNGEAEESTDLTRTFEDHEIRIVQRDGQPWFVAKDVCGALEIGNPSAAVARLDDDEATLTTIEGRSQRRQVNVINEAGVYRLIFTSRKEAAVRFKRWLAHEVIPTIRKTGGYQLNGHPQHSAPDALRILADVLEEQQAQILDLNERLEEMKDEVEEQRTLVEKSSNNGYSVRSGPALRYDFNRAVKAYATSAGIPDREAYKRVYSQISHNGMTVHDAARMRGISKVEMLDRDGKLKDAIKVVERLMDQLKTTA